MVYIKELMLAIMNGIKYSFKILFQVFNMLFDFRNSKGLAQLSFFASCFCILITYLKFEYIASNLMANIIFIILYTTIKFLLSTKRMLEDDFK